MKRNSFDLAGKLIDCTNIDKRVFNTIKLICDGVEDNFIHDVSDCQVGTLPFLSVSEKGVLFLTQLAPIQCHILKPVDILGEPLMEAIEQGFTPAFEGDVIPVWSDYIRTNGIIRKKVPCSVKVGEDSDIIAYRKPSDVSVNSLTSETTRSPEINVDDCFKGVLPREPSDDRFKTTSFSHLKPDFTELKHLDDRPNWKKREQDAYGDDDDKVESLARELFIRHAGDTNGDYNEIADEAWKAAREFYKARES